MAASVSYLARRIVAEIDVYIGIGQEALESGLDLRNYDRACGRMQAFRQMREFVLDLDRMVEGPDEDDDQEQPRSLNTLVADEDAG